MNVRLFRGRRDAVDFFEAKRQAEAQGLRLLTNAEFNSFRPEIERLSKPDSFALACTGTLIAHPKRMGVLGDTVAYVDPVRRKKILMEVPAEFRGLGRIALVSDDFEVLEEGGKVTYSPKSKLSVVSDFPRESGAYDIDPVHGLPVAAATLAGKGYLSRFMNEMVGPIIRVVTRFAGDRRSGLTLNPEPKPHHWALSDDIFVNHCPSGKFIVFATD